MELKKTDGRTNRYNNITLQLPKTKYIGMYGYARVRPRESNSSVRHRAQPAHDDDSRASAPGLTH